MPRTAIQIDRELFERVVKNVEENGPLKNQSELFKAVASNYSQLADVNISHSVAMLRIRDWGISIKTKKGKKGRQPGTKINTGTRSTLSDKLESNTQAQESFASIKRNLPRDEKGNIKPRFLSVFNQAKNGSRTALIKLKCMDCNGFGDGEGRNLTQEIRTCNCIDCPLFVIRPYQE